ncbi:MAG: aconitase X swivel domain-containing protein [Hyphomicrobiales bacterium]
MVVVVIRAAILHEGEAQGPVLALDEPLSFWGGFDPETGVILDVHHPQRGACLTGLVLLMRESRGSASAPGAIAEAIRRGTAPAAVVLVTPDINLAIGAAVAAELYGKHCPVLAVSAADYDSLKQAANLRIARDGALSVF